jgi:hypothetical protein
MLVWNFLWGTILGNCCLAALAIGTVLWLPAYLHARGNRNAPR